MPAAECSGTQHALWFLLENATLCRSPVLSWSSFHWCWGDYLAGSTRVDHLSGWASFLPQARAGGCQRRILSSPHCSFHLKHRFPVLIRGAWLQEVRMALLKRKFCAFLLKPHGKVSVLKQLLALSNEFSVANNPKCFTKGIACRCGYDNLWSMT